MPQNSSLITLFGSTGYTGQLIARALVRAELPFRIAGRSPEKLERQSAELPGRPAWLVADATRPASLPTLFQDTRLLINCAGPFTDLGERVISQAALSGVHYLDITNELGYVFRARSYSGLAKKTGAAIVPACGFEVALADCAAHLAGSALLNLEDPESAPLDQVNILYILEGKGSSQGTRRSAVRSLATSWLVYREGNWIGQAPGAETRKFIIPDGKTTIQRYALSFPSCESITIQSHLPVRQINPWMATTPGARFWAPVFVPLFARLSRSILRGLFLNLAAAGGFSPGSVRNAGLRADSPFTIYVEACRGEQRKYILLTGRDPYGLTADIIAYTARQITAPGYDRSGLLAPAQAIDPRAFLDYAKENWGLSILEQNA
jgi:short subunit dehydrogenase-like uncharacterized protein